MADNSSSRVISSMTTDASSEPDIVELYNDWAKEGVYDENVTSAEHRGSIMAADELEALYEKDKRAKLSIIDIAAGTGRAAVELRGRGFSQIDGLDPSSEMLNVAKKQQLYDRYVCAFISEKQLDIENDRYDVAVCVGAISVGHLPHGAIKEMLRIVKSGGHIIIVGSEREWSRLPEYSVKLTGLIGDLEKEGKLRVLKKAIRDGYMFRETPNQVNAIIYVIEKL